MIAHYKIRIINGTNRSWCWYRKKIGEIFDVAKPQMFCGQMVYQVADGKYSHRIIRVHDTEIVEDYAKDNEKIKCNNTGCLFNKDNVCTSINILNKAVTCYGRI